MHWFFTGEKKQPNTQLPRDPLKVIEDFVACMQENRQPFVTGQEGRRSIELLTAIYKSSQKHKAVKL